MLQGPSKYDIETRAQALALHTQGMTGANVARKLGIPKRTVADWIAQDRTEEQWDPRNHLVISRSTDLTLDYLDAVEDSGEILKHGMTINAIRGTSIDKAQRNSPTQVNIAVQVFNQAREIEQRTVETTATVIDTD